MFSYDKQIGDQIVLYETGNNNKEHIPLWDKRNPIWSVDYSWILRKYLEE